MPVVERSGEGRPANGLGIAGVVIGIIALILCLIPVVNLLVFPLGLVGGILGFVGLVLALSNKRSGPGWPLWGMSLNATAFIGMVVVNFVLVSSIKSSAEKSRVQSQKNIMAQEPATAPAQLPPSDAPPPLQGTTPP